MRKFLNPGGNDLIPLMFVRCSFALAEGGSRMHPPGPPAPLPSLTALRGVAALAGVLFHAPGIGLGSFYVAGTFFVLKSYLWVDFFFLLSGFVMMHAYGARFARGPRPAELVGYALARIGRLYPLHVVMLGVLVAVAAAHAFVGHPQTYDRSPLALDFE